MTFGALLEKGNDADTGVVNPPAKFQQLRLEKFVLGSLHHFGHARLQGDESAGNCVGNEIDLADPDLAAFAKVAALVDGAEERVDLVGERRGERHPGRVARDREKTFARPRVVKALHRRAEAILRNTDADLARSGLLDSVRFVEDN